MTEESNKRFFANVLANAKGVQSIVELGCGAGLNLAALAALGHTYLIGTDISIAALDMIPSGTCRLKVCSDIGVEQTPFPCDLAFTKGCLIHVSPDKIQQAYKNLYAWSKRYILVAEYYNPTPVEVPYRGVYGLLWKRDFAGEMMDLFPDLHLEACGFAYHRDPYPQDDITWFLMAKR